MRVASSSMLARTTPSCPATPRDDNSHALALHLHRTAQSPREGRAARSTASTRGARQGRPPPGSRCRSEMRDDESGSRVAPPRGRGGVVEREGLHLGHWPRGVQLQRRRDGAESAFSDGARPSAASGAYRSAGTKGRSSGAAHMPPEQERGEDRPHGIPSRRRSTTPRFGALRISYTRWLPAARRGPAHCRRDRGRTNRVILVRVPGVQAARSGLRRAETRARSKSPDAGVANRSFGARTRTLLLKISRPPGARSRESTAGPPRIPVGNRRGHGEKGRSGRRASREPTSVTSPVRVSSACAALGGPSRRPLRGRARHLPAGRPRARATLRPRRRASERLHLQSHGTWLPRRQGRTLRRRVRREVPEYFCASESTDCGSKRPATIDAAFCGTYHVRRKARISSTLRFANADHDRGGTGAAGGRPRREGCREAAEGGVLECSINLFAYELAHVIEGSRLNARRDEAHPVALQPEDEREGLGRHRGEVGGVS